MAYDDRDLLIRTVLGEAANQGPEGMAAVAHVIQNRLKSGRYGKSLPDVLFAPKQFEPWNTRRNELMAISPESRAYHNAGTVVDSVLAGEAPDPTGGATHFANVDIVKQRGNQSGLSWIKQMYDNGSAVKIGSHTFGSPDSQPGARPSSVPPQAGQPQQSAPPMNPLLLMQNERMQEQPQQGGLAGMFNDPGKLAALQLLISGLNPWSKGDELAPFARLAQLRQTQGYERQKDERDYKLREQQFQLGRQDREEDNKRADARLKFDQDQAALSPAVKAARDVGLTDPNDPKYRQFIEQYYRKGMTPTIEDQVTERKKAAVTIGLKENSPEYRAYVLTGKMPREDQQPLSATDKKAIMEADEGVMAAQTAITALGEAKALSKKAYEGPFAGQRGYATGLIGSEGGQATTDLNNLVMSNALSQLKSIFGAAPTEGERKILLEIQGSVSQPDAVRQKIYDRAIALAERRLQFNKQRADELRGGSFYKQPGAGGSAPSAPSPTTGLAPGSYDWDGSKLVPRK